MISTQLVGNRDLPGTVCCFLTVSHEEHVHFIYVKQVLQSNNTLRILNTYCKILGNNLTSFQNKIFRGIFENANNFLPKGVGTFQETWTRLCLVILLWLLLTPKGNILFWWNPNVQFPPKYMSNPMPKKKQNTKPLWYIIVFGNCEKVHSIFANCYRSYDFIPASPKLLCQAITMYQGPWLWLSGLCTNLTP